MQHWSFKQLVFDLNAFQIHTLLEIGDFGRDCCDVECRLIPAGNMTMSELFELLSRLTIHIDEDLRSEALACLISFAQDFPDLTDDVVGTYVSFILKQVSFLVKLPARLT